MMVPLRGVVVVVVSRGGEAATGAGAGGIDGDTKVGGNHLKNMPIFHQNSSIRFIFYDCRNSDFRFSAFSTETIFCPS
jgi:hypothetical protein